MQGRIRPRAGIRLRRRIPPGAETPQRSLRRGRHHRPPAGRRLSGARGGDRGRQRRGISAEPQDYVQPSVAPRVPGQDGTILRELYRGDPLDESPLREGDAHGHHRGRGRMFVGSRRVRKSMPGIGPPVRRGSRSPMRQYPRIVFVSLSRIYHRRRIPSHGRGPEGREGTVHQYARGLRGWQGVSGYLRPPCGIDGTQPQGV
mmetsp:Transcript_30250/g.90077  ORF Transcript_30250/g.90077 Transcript_30250/m.90077 type:complete len:202 (-) Transcript_30250:1379-1984(-)